MEETIRGFRLSHQQRRLWLLGGRHPAFHARCILGLEGDCDAVLLKKALGRVIDAHEILRTTFRSRSGVAVPIQVVEPAGCRPVWRQVDLSSLPAQAREESVRKLDRWRCKKPFELGKAPLLEAFLLRLEQRRHLLILALPALGADGPTLSNLAAEIARAYAACVSGETPAAGSEEIVQYVRFSEWQHEILEENAAERQAYWARQNLSALPPLVLPQARGTSASATGEMRCVRVALGPGDAARLEQAVQATASSSRLFLLACFKILLWRFTGKDEIVVAPVVDGRWFEELRGGLGLYARALPVATELTARQPFRSVLKKLEAAVEEVVEQQVHDPPVEKNAGPGEPFAYGFELEERPAPGTHGGLRFTVLDQRATFDRPALKLRAISAAGPGGETSLTVELFYDPALFFAADIERLASHFRTLVASAARRPQAAIIELEIVAPGQRERFLEAFRGPALAVGPGATVVQLFEQQVRRVPDETAVRCETETLCFAELNARANRLAHFLIRQGVAPEVPVALCLERSVEMVVALLATLKAGGCFAPLIPTQPQERLAAMLEELRAPVVLTRRPFAASLPEHRGQQVVLDAGRDAIVRHSPENPPPRAAAGNLAYVVFTSGTTGRPKGVMVEHRQLSNYLAAILERLETPAAASFATVSTFAADLGHTMIFPALATGGCLHVVTQERASDPAAFAGYLEGHAIDCLKIAPSHFEALRSHPRLTSVLPRQRLVLGGEALRPSTVAEVRTARPECQVFNHYGPTEATVGVLTYRVGERPVDPRCRTLPLERPLARTRIYLLDARFEPVPAWVAGELWIGGANVARGYLGQPARTAESFLPDPFSEASGARLYRTGDLARPLPDGTLELTGRLDNQVKFHGIRVELDEIGSALGRDPRVRECAVRLIRDREGREALVAYYVARQELDAAELRTLLARSIPEDVLPNAFVHLTKLPYTANGKLDVAALPSLEAVRERSRATFTAPRNGVEERLAAIWAEVLGLERIGIRDNFFALGGDSIQTIRIIARAAKEGLALSSAQFFEHQTVAELAAVATATESRAAPKPTAGPIPLTPIQQRFFDEEHPEPHHWNLSLALEIHGGAEPRHLEVAFAHLLEHHDALRLRFERAGGGWRQRYAAGGGEAPFVELDLCGLPAGPREKAFAAAVEELQGSLDLERGPLARAAWVAGSGGQPGRLLMIYHHLVVDAVSWRILLEDLAATLRALAGGAAVELPPRTSSFASWAERLAQLADSPEVAEEAGHWLDERLCQTKPLPIDFAGGANVEGNAGTVRISLEREETRALLTAAASSHRAQVEEILLWALLEAFAGWTGRRSLLVDLEGHGREEGLGDLDLSRTVGWFTCVAPCGLDLGKASDPGVALLRIKEALRAVPRRGFAHALVLYLNGESELGKRLGRMPRAEVGFNYLGRLDGAISGPFVMAIDPRLLATMRSARSPRRHLLSVTAWILEQRLHVAWSYSTARHRRETVAALAEGFLVRLRGLLAGEDRAAASPSDFPLAELDRDELDKIAGLLGEP